MKQSMIINQGNELAYKTYRYLRVNEKKMDLGEWEFPQGENLEEAKFLENYEYGLSSEVIELHENHTTKYEQYNTGDFGKIKRESEEILIETVDFIVEEGDSVQGYISTSQKAGTFHSSLYRIHIGKNAHGKIYLANMDEKDTVSLLSLAVVLEEGATLDLYYYALSEANVAANIREYLKGEKSSGNIQAMYLAKDQQELDFLYDVMHEGKESQSDLQVNGALMGHAYKVFKSRLDFAQKSSGSVGNEEEYAILLDETARSLSVPALLSHEDDVEGNHAASAGHIDSSLLFYIMSRGFSEEEAERLIIDAKFAPTIDAIEYEDIREEIYESMERILEARKNVYAS